MNDFAEVNTATVTSKDAECLPAFPTLPKGFERRPALLLVRLGTLLSEMADDRLADAGLGGRGYAILAILGEDGPGSQYELAQMLGKAPAVVVAAIDQLEQAGLVQRNRDPADRRRSVVTPTAAGRDALARADALADEAVSDLLAGLDERELAQLKAWLTKGFRS